MTEDEQKALAAQVDREAKELRDAPVVEPILGEIRRCYICGQVCRAADLRPFDTHIGHTRLACPRCHPERAK